jgi:hypothetical protein
MFTAQEIRKLWEHGTIKRRAMVLLGLNCALGNTDLALLPITAVNFILPAPTYGPHPSAAPLAATCSAEPLATRLSATAIRLVSRMVTAAEKEKWVAMVMAWSI